MRPARLAVLPFVAALLLSGCGGGGQATRPFGPAKLVAEARAAASGQHSAHFHVVIQGTVQHRHALPAGMSAGPYGLVLRGAVTSDDGGRAFQSDILPKYGIAEAFGLPRAVTGLTITLAAHLTHWGATVHVNAPALSTPLPDPGLLRSAV